jgi:predicted RNase H-like nuclease (RuvC/YqgF family)
LSESTEFYRTDGDDEFWGQLGHEGEAAAEAPAEPEPVAEAAPEADVDARGADDFEPEVKAEAEGRPRNPDGTFAPKAVEETAEEAPADPSSLQAQIAQLEKRLADKDDFAGRLSNELGELRKLQEQTLEHAQRPQISDWDALIEENPAQAAQIAIKNGDNFRYQQAREAWNDLAPGAPEVFEQNLRLQHEMAELKQQFQQTTAPLQHQQQTRQVADAYQEIRAKYEDFDKFEDAMAEIVETRPLVKGNLTEVLTSGSHEERVAFLEDLYVLTAGRATDTLRAAQTEAAQSFAQETLQAKQDAIVVSATSTAAEPAQPKTWWDVAEADEKRRADGWNIS